MRKQTKELFLPLPEVECLFFGLFLLLESDIYIVCVKYIMMHY